MCKTNKDKREVQQSYFQQGKDMEIKGGTCIKKKDEILIRSVNHLLTIFDEAQKSSNFDAFQIVDCCLYKFCLQIYETNNKKNYHLNKSSLVKTSLIIFRCSIFFDPIFVTHFQLNWNSER